MVKLVEVAPIDIPTERLGRRGRVSYPLMKSFLEADIKCAKLDLAGLDKGPMALYSVLYTYARTHKLPVKIFMAGGDLFLMRLDMNNEGVKDPNWKPESEIPTEGSAGLLRDDAPEPITSIEVERRFKQEKGKSTK